MKLERFWKEIDFGNLMRIYDVNLDSLVLFKFVAAGRSRGAKSLSAPLRT